MRLHPDLRCTRAVTGRLTTTGFPILGLPKDSPIGKRIRGLVRAPVGSVIYRIDYAQIEFRIAAHLCEDATLIRLYREGRTDFHTLTAHLVLGAPATKAEQDDARHRKPAKAVNFGYWMGMTPKGLTEQVHKAGNLAWSADCHGCQSYQAEHEEDCDSVRVFADFDAAYPGARRYQDARRQRCRDTGYADGLWGERWYLPGIWSPHEEVREAAERQSFALPIQSGNARLIKQAMRQLRDVDLPWAAQQGIPCEPLLQVHDELLFRVPSDVVVDWHRRVQTTMQTIASLRVPIVADGSYGPSWLEQEPL